MLQSMQLCYDKYEFSYLDDVFMALMLRWHIIYENPFLNADDP